MKPSERIKEIIIEGYKVVHGVEPEPGISVQDAYAISAIVKYLDEQQKEQS